MRLAKGGLAARYVLRREPERQWLANLEPSSASVHVRAPSKTRLRFSDEITAVDNGFYYEMALPGGAAVQASDWAPLENIVSKIVKEKQPFQRLV